jgi:hypothetical protein
MSAGYFIAFDDRSVLRSVTFHEFGHIAYVLLRPADKAAVDSVWRELEESALLYLFHDGEYSGNARFGGHPDESPAELFASAFNLLHNRLPEVRAKLKYVEPRHYTLVRRPSPSRPGNIRRADVNTRNPGGKSRSRRGFSFQSRRVGRAGLTCSAAASGAGTA